MRKQILEALKAKFEGVSEAVLGRIADKLAKTVKTEEQVATAVEGVTLQEVIDGYADSRATEAQQTAVRNYESKHGLKDGVKVNNGGVPTQTEPNGNGGDDVPAWAQKIIDSNKALTDRLDKMDGERTAASRTQQLNEAISKLPENLRKAYARTPVEGKTDEEFESLLSEIKEEVEQLSQESAAKGAVFGRPVNNSSASKNTAGGAKEASDAEAQAVVDKMNL